MKSVDTFPSPPPCPPLPRVCLTGGIACGKSLVARFLNDFGVETIDADDIVHELIPDPAARKRLAAEVFSDPAKRRALEAKLHPVVKERINNRIIELSNNRMGGRDSSSSHSAQPSPFTHSSIRTFDHSTIRPFAPSFDHSTIRPFDYSLLPPLAIIPLLFEAHWEKNFDIICCVVSERETQISRMMTTRGYTRAEAEARLAAQMPVAEKAAKSHYVIHNDGTPDELKEKVKEFLTWLTRRS